MNTFGSLHADKEGPTAGTDREQLPTIMSKISSKKFLPDVIAKIDAQVPVEPSYSFRTDSDGKKKAVGVYWKRVEQCFNA